MKKQIFTKEELWEIVECLETLEAMSGAYDEEFTKECKKSWETCKENKKIHSKSIKYGIRIKEIRLTTSYRMF